MEQQDKKLASLKCQSRNLNYKDIYDGVYINSDFVKFNVIEIFENIVMYLPENFINMPESVSAMKYLSEKRPKVIKTNLGTDVNFTFNFFEEKFEAENMPEYAKQLKMSIKKINPSFRFLEEKKSQTNQHKMIEMFDFISYGLDDQIYNMMCLVALDKGLLQTTFNCLDRDSEEWKDVAWLAFLTIEELHI